MTDKQEIIRQMMAMQRQFIDIERQGGFSAEAWYDTDGDSELARIRRSYDEMATRLVDMAHAEKGSHR